MLAIDIITEGLLWGGNCAKHTAVVGLSHKSQRSGPSIGNYTNYPQTGTEARLSEALHKAQNLCFLPHRMRSLLRGWDTAITSERDPAWNSVTHFQVAVEKKNRVI